jgi:hypothetical protein
MSSSRGSFLDELGPETGPILDSTTELMTAVETRTTQLSQLPDLVDAVKCVQDIIVLAKVRSYVLCTIPSMFNPLL